MTIAHLRPGTPYFYDARLVGADVAYVHAATLVGSGGVWSDDSDATYVDIEEQVHDGGEGTSTLSADFPAIGVPGATLNSINLRVRGMFLEDRAVNSLLIFSETGTTRNIGNFSPPWSVARPLVTEEVVWEPLGLWDEAILTTGFRVTVYADSADTTLRQAWRCHELELIVDYTAPAGGAPVLPVRLFPRKSRMGSPRIGPESFD